MILTDNEMNDIRRSIETHAGLDDELMQRCGPLIHMDQFDEAVRSAFVLLEERLRKATEFGHKVWLDEVEGGIVTQWRVLDGNPPDRDQWQPSLAHHVPQFGRPPDQVSGDRGVYSPENEVHAHRIRAKRIILAKPDRMSDSRRQHEQ